RTQNQSPALQGLASGADEMIIRRNLWPPQTVRRRLPQQLIRCESGAQGKGESSMKQWAKTWLRTGTMAAAVAALLLLGAAPKAKAQDSSITGTLSDLDGKPWPGQTVTLESELGAKSEVKSDANGRYTFSALKTGNYKIFVNLPYQKEPYLAAAVKVT